MIRVEVKKIISGNSIINGIVVVSMNATVYEDGRTSFTSSIHDVEVYESNIAEIQNDIENFKQSVR